MVLCPIYLTINHHPRRDFPAGIFPLSPYATNYATHRAIQTSLQIPLFARQIFTLS